MKKDKSESKSKLPLLLNLWPAALVAVISAAAIMGEKPALAAVPEKLVYTAPESVEENDPLSKKARSDKTKKTEDESIVVSDETGIVAIHAGEVVQEAFSDPASYKDGTYTGTAQGFGGSITVQVDVKDGKISNITVLDASSETGEYFERAENVIDSILVSGSPNVDTVSGATYSSAGIINAVKRALANAASAAGNVNVGSEADTVIELPPIQIGSGEADLILPDMFLKTDDIKTEASEKYKDGVYKGEGRGFGGDIVIELTVEDGKLCRIKVLSADKETPSYFNKTSSMVEEILIRQSTDVDVVSGATFSSEGILDAVDAALEQSKETITDIVDDTDNKEETDRDPDHTEKSPETDSDSDYTENDPETDDSEITKPVQYLYQTGVYSACVTCTDEEMFDYDIRVDCEIEDDKFLFINAVIEADRSDDPDSNLIYFDYAMKGRTKRGLVYQGIEGQMMEKEIGSRIDIVSGATYSSNALIDAINDILARARIPSAIDEGVNV